MQEVGRPDVELGVGFIRDDAALLYAKLATPKAVFKDPSFIEERCGNSSGNNDDTTCWGRTAWQCFRRVKDWRRISSAMPRRLLVGCKDHAALEGCRERAAFVASAHPPEFGRKPF